MADQQQENKEQINKEPVVETPATESPKSGERAPENPAEKKPAGSREKAGNLRQKIEQKPSGGGSGLTSLPDKDDSKSKVRIQKLKKLRQADPKKFAQKLDEITQKEVKEGKFEEADNQHDETITNTRLN